MEQRTPLPPARPPGALVAVLPCRAAAVPQALNRVAGIIRTHRKRIDSRCRTPDPGEPALLPLAYPGKGERLRTLTAGSGISAATARHTFRETSALLAAEAPGLRDGLHRAQRSGPAFTALDGTLTRIRRNRIDQPFHSGKHQCHRMNLQAVSGARSQSLRISDALHGWIHDTAAARILQLPRLLAEFELFALGDKGYRGLDDEVTVTPFRGKGKPKWQKEANRLHSRLHAPGERAFAQRKKWPVFDLLPRNPDPTTEITKALQILNHHEHQTRQNEFTDFSRLQ